MPGFLMHLVEGEMILNRLKNQINIPQTFTEEFMLGCILPDVTSDKERTHFRPLYQKYQITKYPDMAAVYALYKNQELSPIDLGILTHLQLDASYVTDFWQHYFAFEDESGAFSVDIRHPLFVRLLKGQEVRIPLADFFSDKWFYGEYDRINPVLNRRFHPFVPDHVPYRTEDIHIKECIPEDAEMIKTSLSAYIGTAEAIGSEDQAAFGSGNQNVFGSKNQAVGSGDQATDFDTQNSPDNNCMTKVFPYKDIISFLQEQADNYLAMPYMKNILCK